MKETTMKSSNAFRRILATTCLAAASLGLLLPGVSLADGKGAAKLMNLNNFSTMSQTHNSTPMISGCPRCKDAFVAVTDHSAKGAQLALAKNVATHLCPACRTTISTVGTGKAKTDRVDHNCGTMANSTGACCTATR